MDSPDSPDPSHNSDPVASQADADTVLANDDTKPSYTPGQSNIKFHPNPRAWLVIIFVLLVLGAGGLYYYLHYYHKAKPVTATLKHDIPLIRIGISDGEASSPFYPDTPSEAGDVEIQNQLFEALIGYEGGTKLVPRLATSWTNPNSSTWDFTLRSGVKFHSGRTMTADDVKYSLNTFKDTAFSDVVDYGSTIKAVTVLAPNKVQITTNGPDPTLLARLAQLDIIDSHNTKPDDPINGTGPYTLRTGSDPAKSGVFDLVADDDYWGGHVYTRELQFSFPSDETEGVTLLKDHKLDVYSDFGKVASLNTLHQAGMSVIPDADGDVGFFQLNTKYPGSPLDNLKFRQGIALALNRQSLIDAAGTKGTPINQLVPQSIPGYDPSITVPKQDIAQAKALVAESGVKNPTITLSYSDEDAIGQETQKELAAVGVTVKLNPFSDFGAFNTAVFGGQTELSYYGESSSLFDAFDIFQTFINSPNYDNPAFDQALAASDQTIDVAKHIALLQQAAKILNADVAVIPITASDFYSGSALKGVALTSDVPGVDAGVYFWKVYQP